MTLTLSDGVVAAAPLAFVDHRAHPKPCGEVPAARVEVGRELFLSAETGLPERTRVQLEAGCAGAEARVLAGEVGAEGAVRIALGAFDCPLLQLDLHEAFGGRVVFSDATWSLRFGCAHIWHEEGGLAACEHEERTQSSSCADGACERLGTSRSGHGLAAWWGDHGLSASVHEYARTHEMDGPYAGECSSAEQQYAWREEGREAAVASEVLWAEAGLGEVATADSVRCEEETTYEHERGGRRAYAHVGSPVALAEAEAGASRSLTTAAGAAECMDGAHAELSVQLPAPVGSAAVSSQRGSACAASSA